MSPDTFFPIEVKHPLFLATKVVVISAKTHTSATLPVSELTPEGTSNETTGYLIPSLLIVRTESLIFLLRFPLRPVPTNASAITVSLESFKFFMERA